MVVGTVLAVTDGVEGIKVVLCCWLVCEIAMVADGVADAVVDDGEEVVSEAVRGSVM